MSVLVQTLTTKKKLYYLNLSYNNMLDSTQNRVNVKAFCKGIRRVLKKTRIFHLDLSHMNLGFAARKFGESFINSPTLCSVHLSGNGIPAETVSYLDSLLRIPDLPQVTNFLAGRLNTC